MNNGTSILIVGTGFAGLCMAIRLKMAGVDDFLVLEKAGEIGGTWRDNHYPGAACDVQSLLYSFSFEQNPEWTRTFAGQAEIQDYLVMCARKYGVMPHIRFGATVERAVYDEASGVWGVDCSDGRAFSARSLVLAAGGLSRPSLPDIPGLRDFKGALFHTAQWDHGFETRGRRVAVIGTGASAIQVVPAIAKRTGQLKVFQRTPPWILPKPDRRVSALERAVYRRVRSAMRFARVATYVQNESRAVGFVLAPGILRAFQPLALMYLKWQVKDAALRKKLTPDYTLGCKRVLLSNDYFKALQRPNVELVTDGIRSVGARSIVTQDGREHEVDAIVMATGFLAAEVCAPFEVRGTGQRELRAEWSRGAEAFLGSTVHGYPNLFMMVGPNTGLGHSSMVLMIEAQAAYILDALLMMRRRGIKSVEVRASAQAHYNSALQKRLRRTVWSTGGCVSWYRTSSGKNTTLYPGFTFGFRAKTRKFEAGAYQLKEIS